MTTIELLQIGFVAIGANIAVEELAARYKWRKWQVITAGVLVASLLVLAVAKEVLK